MNHQQNPAANQDHVLKIQIAIPQEMMRSMIEQLAPSLAQQLKNALLIPTSIPQAEQKLSYSVVETAGLLGVSTKTVYGLLQRRLLKSSGALRTKLITKKNPTLPEPNHQERVLVHSSDVSNRLATAPPHLAHLPVRIKSPLGFAMKATILTLAGTVHLDAATPSN